MGFLLCVYVLYRLSMSYYSGQQQGQGGPQANNMNTLSHQQQQYLLQQQQHQQHQQHQQQAYAAAQYQVTNQERINNVTMTIEVSTEWVRDSSFLSFFLSTRQQQTTKRDVTCVCVWRERQTEGQKKVVAMHKT